MLVSKCVSVCESVSVCVSVRECVVCIRSPGLLFRFELSLLVLELLSLHLLLFPQLLLRGGLLLFQLRLNRHAKRSGSHSVLSR